MAQTYVRNIDAETIGRVNSALDGFSSSSEHFRALELAAPLGLFVMSKSSFTNVQNLLYTPLNQNRLARAFGGDETEISPTNNPVTALPFMVKFPRLRKFGDIIIKQEAEDAGFNRLGGIRRVSLEIKPINDSDFCPLEFKKLTEEIGATEFYETPADVTIGWTVLQTDTMREYGENILKSILVTTPYVVLEPITIGS